MDESQKAGQLRTVFMGTPDFAAAVLSRVLDSGLADMAGIYTQPDRPCGRGHKCTPSPVKMLAIEQDIPCYQPVNFKDPADVEQLAALKPDILLVAAYGLILPQRVLDIPLLGPWNVHASLLPRYRGAAPIQRALMDGEAETGVTIMRMEAGMDTGPMLIKRSIPIGPDENAGSLHDRLAALGGDMAVEAMELLIKGPVNPLPQDPGLATYAPKLTKEDTLLRWDRPVREVHDHIRAMYPRPGASFMVELPGENRRIRLQAAPGGYSLGLPSPAPPGCILGLSGGSLEIACLDGVYRLPSIKPEGKKFMDATAFACGYLSRIDPSLPLVCPPPAGFCPD